MNATRPVQYPPPPAPPEDERSRFRVRPGAVVLVLGLALVGVIAAGVLLNNTSVGRGPERVTIAQLRADPDRWDNQSIVVEGAAEDIRQLPYLTQYAVYTFRDETGSMLVLTQKGAPPSDAPNRVALQAVYHSRVTLDDELRGIVEDQLGGLAGSLVSLLLPGVPLNVVFLEHERYAPLATP